MKPSIINIVTILMLASIVGCHSKSSIYMQLELVDTLLRHDNDTAAYHVLNTIMDLDDEECRAYYYLLKTQTDYKLYREIFSDSIINIAAEFYTTHSTDMEKLGNALHYQSVVNYDLGNTDKAILYAKKAEDIAEDTKNYALQNKVYLLLAVFNNAAHDNTLSIEYTHKQLEAARNAHNDKWVAYAMLNLAIVYSSDKNTDSVQYYIKQIQRTIKALDKTAQAHYYYCMGQIASDTTTSIQYYDSSAKCNPLPHVLASQAALIKDDTSTISRLCDQILASQAWPETKISALEVMSDIYCRCNDVHKLKEVEDSIKSEMWKMNQNILTDKTVEKQQRYNIEKAELKFHQLIITIMFSSVIVLFVCLVIYLRKKLKTKQYEAEISNQAIAISNLKGNIIFAQNRMQELEAINQQLEDRLSKGGSISEIERGKLAVQMENSQKELAETQNQLSELNAQLDKYMKIFANGRNLYESIKRGGNAATWTDDDYTDYYYYALLENDIDLSEYDDLTPLQKFTVIQLKMTDNYATVANMLGISESSLRTSVNRIEKKRKKRC
ncbi:MAG: hypothetical protein IKQ30_06855 [Bacteroidales bacterium]|nr:hypothetical protein [Bacteroidales bacterium]